VTDWIVKNYIEIIGVITGILYIIFSVKQKVICWPFGIVNSALYIIIYNGNKLYANSVLQAYYLIMGVYGWYYWMKGSKSINGEKEGSSVRRISLKNILIITILGVFVLLAINYLLVYFKDQDSLLDSFTTMLSFIATWMLTKKYIENWILWIIIDTISVGWYLSMRMYPTAGLYLVFTILAIFGYLEWKKEITLKEVIKIN
jgi:nicotinamide mononucleotide transporter